MATELQLIQPPASAAVHSTFRRAEPPTSIRTEPPTSTQAEHVEPPAASRSCASPDEWVAAVAAYVRRHPVNTSLGPPLAHGNPAPNSERQVSEPGPTQLVAPPAPRRSEDLVYSEAPADKRRAVLDAVIRDLIFDDEFLVLCQDVEASAQRAGLGW